MLLTLAGCTGTNLEGGLAATGLSGATTLAAAAPDRATLPPAAIPDAGEAAVQTAAAQASTDDGPEAATPSFEAATTAVANPSVRDEATAGAASTNPLVLAATTAPAPPAIVPGSGDATRQFRSSPGLAGVLALAPTETRRERRNAFRAKAESANLIAPRETRRQRREGSVRIVKPRKATTASVLPGVRSRSSIFGFGRQTTNDGARAFRVASAAGLARLSDNGLRKQTAHVKTECFKPELVAVLQRAEQHFGRPVTVTSGYRSPNGNRRAGGAKQSKHMTCEAADVQIEGVSKWTLASYFRSIPGRGGVGTYCHTESVHIDVGSERDWNWKCRKRG